MKLLYCIPSLYNPGGMERIITDKINYLIEKYNYEVYVVTTEQSDKPYYFKLNNKVKIYNLNINFNHDFNLSFFKKLNQTKEKNKIYKEQLENLLNSNDINICISTGGKELEFLQNINSPCKKILEYHFAKDFRKQFLLARKNSFLNKLIGEFRVKQLIYQTKNLDKVIVLTKMDKEQWIKTNKNVEHIYNFSSSKYNTVSELHNNTAIAIGRLDAQKGFDLLIEAWNINKEKLKNWKLNIFGQGEWFDYLSFKIKQYHLENNIILRGTSNDIERELLNSSIFLFSSRYEGFGLVLLEAMQKGIPSVSFNCPEGPSELLEGNAGFLVPLFDLQKFSHHIVELAENFELRKKIGENALLQSQKFSKDEIMKCWDNLFKKLI